MIVRKQNIRFFVSQESLVKTKKQNGYNNMYSSCSTALIANSPCPEKRCHFIFVYNYAKC